VRELRDGLWHWRAPHPGWRAGEPWDELVSSYALDDGKRLVLFDPLAPPSRLLDLAGEREPVIVLTAPWHERDTRSLVERFGPPVHVPPPDSAEDLIRKYGITVEQAGEGSPDIRWLLAGEGGAEWHPYAAGDRLPIGAEAFPGRESNDLVLWVESIGAVISGDTLVDFGEGLQIAPWLREDVTRESVAAGLRPLLDLPVKLVLPAHGEPTDGAALARALA
jgi:glyoxylase-like metal-dependent hydrolase (beta-lactamase superfamily II)